MTTTLDTTNWISKPFTANGINFVSKLDPNGSIYKKVVNMRLSDESFNSMNTLAIMDLWALYKRSDVVELLEKINHGATEAVIELDLINE